jgi:hypothetical protein
VRGGEVAEHAPKLPAGQLDPCHERPRQVDVTVDGVDQRVDRDVAVLNAEPKRMLAGGVTITVAHTSPMPSVRPNCVGGSNARLRRPAGAGGLLYAQQTTAFVGSIIVLVVDRYKALKRSALGVGMTRYTLGSLVAAATSAVVFAVLYALGASTNVLGVGVRRGCDPELDPEPPLGLEVVRRAVRLEVRALRTMDLLGAQSRRHRARSLADVGCRARRSRPVAWRRLTVQNDVPMTAVGGNTLCAKRMRN